jgi:hypothetical protein
LSAAAQSGREALPVRDSKLAAVSLPGGAQQVEEQSVPKEIKDTLAKIIALGGDKVRQGDSEVFVWNGNYKKANGSQMVKKLENALQASGWVYEIGERSNEYVVFSLSRNEPSPRFLFGFYVPSEDGFVLALTEMLAANAPANKTKERSSSETKQPAKTSQSSSVSSNLVGKWFRTTGSGFIDYTGKTNYKAGENFTFEFFADGTVEYTREKDVLSIVQCRTKASDNARGTYSVSGNRLTIDLGAAKSVGSSTCDSKDNYNKSLPATSIVKTFTIKQMESITRPDKPMMLCFEGQEGSDCFEKTVK